MLHEGQEFRKNKRGNDNSYDQDNEVNWIDWNLKAKNKSSFAFYANLVKLRRANGAFRQAACVSDQTIRWLRPQNEQAVGYLLRGPGNEPDFLVLLNGHASDWVTFELPSAGAWEVVCSGDAATASGNLGTASGDYKVPASTGVILRAPSKQWR
jgi:pullulanase/glycogen debranching enzyme